jgi:hypothetical protein
VQTRRRGAAIESRSAARSGSTKSSGFSSTAFAIENTATVAPMPIASVSIATIAKAGARWSRRSA